MSKIIVARNGQEIGSYSQVEIEHLVSSHYLQSDDHYWMEGMADWGILSELVPVTELIVRPTALVAPVTHLRPLPPEPPLPQYPATPQAQQPVIVNVVNNNNVNGNTRGPTAVIVGDRKSGIVAAFLNFIIPGLGYMYCGRIFLGLIAFVVTIVVVVGTLGVGALIMCPILVIDGFLCAARANRQVILIQ